jgi:cell division protein FtsB
MEELERLKKDIFLLNVDLKNWRTSYNVTIIMKQRDEIEQLKKENERLSKEINQLTRQ